MDGFIYLYACFIEMERKMERDNDDDAGAPTSLSFKSDIGELSQGLADHALNFVS